MRVARSTARWGLEAAAATTAAGESFRAPVTSRRVRRAAPEEEVEREWRRARREESPTTAVQPAREISAQKLRRERTSLEGRGRVSCLARARERGRDGGPGGPGAPPALAGERCARAGVHWEEAEDHGEEGVGPVSADAARREGEREARQSC